MTQPPTLKLSEAMRLGAMLKPQIFGEVFDGVGTCAMGAAYDAIGALDQLPCIYDILKTDNNILPITCAGALQWHRGILREPAICPECGSADHLHYIVTHLNDSHRWSRERIADYIATIETQKEAPEQLVELQATI